MDRFALVQGAFLRRSAEKQHGFAAVFGVDDYDYHVSDRHLGHGAASGSPRASSEAERRCQKTAQRIMTLHSKQAKIKRAHLLSHAYLK